MCVCGVRARACVRVCAGVCVRVRARACVCVVVQLTVCVSYKVRLYKCVLHSPQTLLTGHAHYFEEVFCAHNNSSFSEICEDLSMN